MVKSVGKVKKSKTKMTKSAAERRNYSSKVDELKLGKFDDCMPMRLPESKVRRSWQIVGGIGLLLIAAYCVVMMVTNMPFQYLSWGGVDIWRVEQLALTISWIVNNVALILFMVVALMSSIILFVGKRVPVGMWYMMIVLLVAGFVSQSMGIYENFTSRECVQETCPMVVGELSMVLLCNLVIMMVAILLLWLVHCLNKCRYVPDKGRKRQ